MTTRLLNRLGAARERQFVGRTAEVDLFRAAVSAAELPFNVLFVYGPGGVGKSALLNAFARMAEQCGAGVYYLDARSFEPSPEAVQAALREYGRPDASRASPKRSGSRRLAAASPAHLSTNWAAFGLAPASRCAILSLPVRASADSLIKCL